MNIENMDFEQVEQRSAELEAKLSEDNADFDAIETEIKALEERKAVLNREVEERKAMVQDVLTNAKTIETFTKEEVHKKMELRELRNTPEYIDAFAEYIKGNKKEMRTLLTENAVIGGGGEEEATTGDIAVPSIVEDRIWTDWMNTPLLARIRKVYVKGNYRVGYEASASGAVIHKEGTDAPKEEELSIQYIDFISEYLKKWIKVSDTVLALRGQAFLDYIFDEFGHQIALALENYIVAEIIASNLTPKVTVSAMDSKTVLAGIARLSDEAINPVAIMSKSTYATIAGERTTAGARIENPFEGLEVLFNNTVTGVLVGDLDGVVANFPDGMDFKFVVDEYSLAEYDLVKIIGKLLFSAHLVRPNGFVQVKTE